MAGDLVDKLMGLPASGGKKVPGHQFVAGLYLWATGSITRASLVTRLGQYGLNEAEDGGQLDWLQSTYNSLSGDAKLLFFLRVESCCVLGEVGAINKTEFLNLINSS